MDAIKDKNAFKLYHAYIQLWESDSDSQLQSSQIEVEARRCVILAIIDPQVINFDEVLSLKAIKHL